MVLGRNIKVVYFVSILVILSIYSCDKFHAKKYEGTYECSVFYEIRDISPMHFDSSYIEILKVEREGKYIRVLDKKIHIDSLWKGKEYYEFRPHYFYSLRFSKDSIFLSYGGGGLGFQWSSDYKGKKD